MTSGSWFFRFNCQWWRTKSVETNIINDKEIYNICNKEILRIKKMLNRNKTFLLQLLANTTVYNTSCCWRVYFDKVPTATSYCGHIKEVVFLTYYSAVATCLWSVYEVLEVYMKFLIYTSVWVIAQIAWMNPTVSLVENRSVSTSEAERCWKENAGLMISLLLLKQQRSRPCVLCSTSLRRRCEQQSSTSSTVVPQITKYLVR